MPFFISIAREFDDRNEFDFIPAEYLTFSNSAFLRIELTSDEILILKLKYPDNDFVEIESGIHCYTWSRIFGNRYSNELVNFLRELKT